MCNKYLWYIFYLIIFVGLIQCNVIQIAFKILHGLSSASRFMIYHPCPIKYSMLCSVCKQIAKCICDLRMTANLDVFVGNDTLIDPDIYQLWLNGHSGRLISLPEQFVAL